VEPVALPVAASRNIFARENGVVVPNIRVVAVVVARVDVAATVSVFIRPFVANKLVVVLFVKNVDEANTIPVLVMPKSVAPDDDATLNGFRLDVEVACTLKTYEEEVALIPATTPLSTSVEVPSVVADSQRVAYPKRPPDSDPEIPREDVAVHLVDVPIERRTIPCVPVALVPSKRAPERVRLVVDELVILASVV
jgi:hypothetical protein